MSGSADVKKISDEKKDIYSVYKAIFETNLSMQKKKTLLTTLLGANEWSWKVVGISEKALEELKKNEYNYVKGVVRAHIVARIDTANMVFDSKRGPLEERDFFEKIIFNDKTVLTMKEENKTRKPLPAAIPISSEENLFPCQHVGYKHEKAAAAYLKELHRKFHAGEINAVPALELL